MKAHVCLRFLYDLQELHVFRYNLSEVRHFLQQLCKQLWGFGVIQLQLELQSLQQIVLYIFNGLHIQQTWAVYGIKREL